MGGAVYKLKPFYLIVASILFLHTGCAKKKMNERDSKKEQVRSSAQTKKQELMLTAGQYYGQLKNNSYNQDVLLNLEVKDIPTKNGEEIDPILIPVITGSMKIFFGDPEKGEYYSLAIEKADFDAQKNKLDLVVTHEFLKEMIVSLAVSDPSLEGTWNSPTFSTSGGLSLTKNVDLKLLNFSVRELKGEYLGILDWDAKKLYQKAHLNLSTKQDKTSAVSFTASVKLYSGDENSSETMVYDLDRIDFNPLTHTISLDGQNSDVFFIGSYASGKITGNWHSKLYGNMGSMLWQKQTFPKPSENKKLLNPIKGTYYGVFKNADSSIHLPSRFMINLVTYYDREKSGGMGIAGSVRLYYGSFASKEFIELPLDHLEYNFFTRNLTGLTSGAAKFSIDLVTSENTLVGVLSDTATGVVGSIDANLEVPTETYSSMGGAFSGYFTWDKEQRYQISHFELTSSFKNQEGIKLMTSLEMKVGQEDSLEKVVFKFQEADFNPTSGSVVLKSSDENITLKGTLIENQFYGEWFTRTKGKLGRFVLKKNETVPLPQDFNLISPIHGTYLGLLQNTSSQTNLPERMTLGVVTILDLTAPYGLKLSSNIRFYLGPFDSDEYVEGKCETISFDFFSQNYSVKCALPQMDGFSLSGRMFDSKIVGKVSYDGIGEVAQFEVIAQ